MPGSFSPSSHHMSNEKTKCFCPPSLTLEYITLSGIKFHDYSWATMVIWSDRTLVAHICGSSFSLWQSPVACAPHHWAEQGPVLWDKPCHICLSSFHKCCQVIWPSLCPGGVKIWKQMEEEPYLCWATCRAQAVGRMMSHVPRAIISWPLFLSLRKKLLWA